MNRPADTATRVQFITGLRELADFLARNPGIPVPAHGETIFAHVNTPEEGGRYQISAIAAALGVPVRDETTIGGHYYAQKSFGPLVYRAASIPGICMARHEALWSYHGCVDPGDGTATLDA